MFVPNPIPFYTPRILVGRFPGIHYEAGDGGAQNPPPDDKGDEDPPPDDKKGGNNGNPELSETKLKDRLERAEKARENKILKELGFDSIDAVKNRLKVASDFEKANMTETERLKAEADEAKAKSVELAAMLSRTETERTQERNRSAIERVLQSAGINDNEYLEFATERAEKFVKANLGDEAVVNAETLQEFVDDLREKKPAMFGVQDSPMSTGKKSTPKPKGAEDKAKAKTEAEIKAMPREEYEEYKATLLANMR